MIEIQKHNNEYVVVNTATRRIIGRSKSQGVALEQARQLTSHHERRDEQLRRNVETRAEAAGA